MHLVHCLVFVCFILYQFSFSYFYVVIVVNVYYQEHRKKKEEEEAKETILDFLQGTVKVL